MKEMISVYMTRTTDDLRRLKSEKHNRLTKLRKQFMSYSVQQEIRVLEFQMSRIDTVLRSRAEQGRLFP